MPEYQLYLGDCVDVMSRLEDCSVDLTVTSPPYDNLRKYKGYRFDFPKIANQLYRITKEGGAVVWIVADETSNGSETCTSFRQALYFVSLGFRLHDTMIWKKQTFTDTGSLRVRYGGVFEYMFVFSKGKIKTFNPIKDRANKLPNKKKHGTVRQKDGSLKPISSIGKKVGEIGQRFNVWEINTEVSNTKRRHPAQFPEPLARDHIVSWSNEGDTVLDCFMGSGTTGKMALLNNRKFIGIEIASEYFAIAAQRIQDSIKDVEHA